jgi:hypothetical protein
MLNNNTDIKSFNEKCKDMRLGSPNPNGNLGLSLSLKKKRVGLRL